MHRSAGSSELRYAPSSIEQVSAQESSNDLRSFANRRLFAHVSLPVNNPRCRRAVGDAHSYFITKRNLFRGTRRAPNQQWQPPGPLAERCVHRDLDQDFCKGSLGEPSPKPSTKVLYLLSRPLSSTPMPSVAETANLDG